MNRATTRKLFGFATGAATLAVALFTTPLFGQTVVTPVAPIQTSGGTWPARCWIRA